MTIEINAGEDLVPLSRFGDGSKYVTDVVRTGRPKVITEGGVGVAVILDLETFQALQTETAARELLRDLEQALAEADGDQMLDHETVMADARAESVRRASERGSPRSEPV